VGHLRILFLTQTFPRFAHDSSGPFIRDLARGLARAGDWVRVLVPDGPEVRSERLDDGVEVRSFRYAPRAFETVGYGRSLHADERLRSASALASPLYLLGARRALARELRSDSWDLVHAHWIVPNGLLAAPLAGAVPLAIGLHGSDVFLAERFWVRGWARRALSRASLLTSCSPELARRIEAIGFERAKTRVIPYGVDIELFRPDPARRSIWRERLGVPEAAPMALSVGRMATKKGFHVLLGELDELFRRVPDLHLVLAGGGDRLDEWRRATERWRPQVHFPGAVMHDSLPDLYRAADLFVLPAVHDAHGNVDGLPNVILEAMATGLPVIASAISGIPLAVSEGLNGRLVPEADGGALVEALAELAVSAGECRRMGQESRRRAEADLTWDAVAGQYREAYLSALNRA
jgi:glycosyltransferase involved in cell wall biosynthesis